jgi:hypothetical protein
MFPAKIILQGRVGCGVQVPGKSLSAGVRNFSQAAIIPLPVAVLVEKINGNSLAQLEVLAVTIIRSSFFSAFSLIIASQKTRTGTSASPSCGGWFRFPARRNWTTRSNKGSSQFSPD